jgi:hypothetical protein
VKLTWISGKQAFADPLSIFRYPLSIIDNDKSPMPYGIRLHGRKQKPGGRFSRPFLPAESYFPAAVRRVSALPAAGTPPAILIKTA